MVFSSTVSLERLNLYMHGKARAKFSTARYYSEDSTAAPLFISSQASLASRNPY